MDPVVGPWRASQEEIKCPLALHIVVSVEQLPLFMTCWEDKVVNIRNKDLR